MDRVESAKCSFLFDLLDFVDHELDVGREKVNVDEPLELGKGYSGIFDVALHAPPHVGGAVYEETVRVNQFSIGVELPNHIMGTKLAHFQTVLKVDARPDLVRLSIDSPKNDGAFASSAVRTYVHMMNGLLEFLVARSFG